MASPELCMESKFYRGGLVCQTTNKQAPWKHNEVSFDLISRARMFSDRSCRKKSTGNPSRRSLTLQFVPWQIVVGQPSEAGPYTIRVKAPHGAKLMPHRHPEDRVYTVISGVFYIGLGDQFDADKLHAYPAGSVIVLHGNTTHFHWSKSSEYITQVSAIGPRGLEYVNAKDDPRNQQSGN